MQISSPKYWKPQQQKVTREKATSNISSSKYSRGILPFVANRLRNQNRTMIKTHTHIWWTVLLPDAWNMKEKKHIKFKSERWIKSDSHWISRVTIPTGMSVFFLLLWPVDIQQHGDKKRGVIFLQVCTAHLKQKGSDTRTYLAAHWSSTGKTSKCFEKHLKESHLLVQTSMKSIGGYCFLVPTRRV